MTASTLFCCFDVFDDMAGPESPCSLRSHVMHNSEFATVYLRTFRWQQINYIV